MLAISHVCPWASASSYLPSLVALSRQFSQATFMPPRGRPTLVDVVLDAIDCWRHGGLGGLHGASTTQVSKSVTRRGYYEGFGCAGSCAPQSIAARFVVTLP